MWILYNRYVTNLTFSFAAVFIITCYLLLTWTNDATYKSRQFNYSVNRASSFAATYPSVCGSVTNKATCGTSLRLDAEANQSNYTWSTGETTPFITVNSSGSYWWETIDLDNNLVVNGNFSAGNSDFTSEYTYIAPTGSTGPAGALQSEAYYTVTTNPRNTHIAFSSFPDHTGGGNMMVVNGAPTADVTIWKQVIDVQPNTDYVFSVWFTSVHPSNPGILQFTINNDDQGTPIMLTSALPGWKNFLVRWNSNNRNKATIAITNQNTTAIGNDFALDDIVFAPVCRNYFNVTFNPSPPKPVITPQ